MKFRYYITDLFDGTTAGTDDIKIALNCSGCEDYSVVDSHTGEWLQINGNKVPIHDISKEVNE